MVFLVPCGFTWFLHTVASPSNSLFSFSYSMMAYIESSFQFSPCDAEKKNWFGYYRYFSSKLVNFYIRIIMRNSWYNLCIIGGFEEYVYIFQSLYYLNTVCYVIYLLKLHFFCRYFNDMNCISVTEILCRWYVTSVSVWIFEFQINKRLHFLYLYF